jgi:hypothetical protein
MITYKDLPVERAKKLKLTVTMDVTAPQAYALMEMFKCWTFYGKAGMSRKVGFYVDGDGDFKPNCEVKTVPELPELPLEQAKKAVANDDNGNCLYDFDGIGWSLHPSNT